MNLTLFPDTNFFFELPAASALPWQDLASSGQTIESVRVILPRPVVAEIERHKNKGNSRTASRARDVSAWIRQARRGPLEIKREKPRVTFEISPLVPLDFTLYAFLDPNKADHEIIAQFAALKAVEPELEIISDDTLMIMAAEQCGFSPIEVPEGWKLPAEKDERDKKIDVLEQEIKLLKHAAPALRVAMCQTEGAVENSINVSTKSYSDHYVTTTEIASSIASRYPKQPIQLAPLGLGVVLNPLSTWRPPSDESYAQYANTDHPAWEHGLASDLEAITQAACARTKRVRIWFKLENNGHANALNVRFKISAFDGFLISRRERVPEGAPKRRTTLKPPPSSPSGKWVSKFPLIAAADLFPHLRNPIQMAPPMALSGLRLNQGRDPNTFYFSDGTELGPSLILDCAALPHQVDGTSLSFDLLIPDENLKGRSRLEILVQSSNVPKPIKLTVPINVTEAFYSVADWYRDNANDVFGERTEGDR